MRAGFVILGLWSSLAHADDRPPAARLDFGLSAAQVRQVLVDGKPATDWIGDRVVRVAGTGWKRIDVTFERDGRTTRTTQYVGIAPGVEVRLQDHNGAIVVAQPPGKRCGRATGSAGPWVLCDAPDRRIPVGVTVELACANPVDLGADHTLWIDDAARPTSPVFVPTLPGLYRARYRRGRISITYAPSACAGARPVDR